MVDDFDPYYDWLGIPPEEQPPHHYRLLGLSLFEDDLEAIANAADREMGHVRTFQVGRRAKQSQKLLNEISAAKVCLLNSKSKAEYDGRLQEALQTTTAAPAKATPRPARQRAVPQVPTATASVHTTHEVASGRSRRLVASRRMLWLIPLATGSAALLAAVVVTAIIAARSRSAAQLTESALVAEGSGDGLVDNGSGGTADKATTSEGTGESGDGLLAERDTNPQSVAQTVRLTGAGRWVDVGRLVDPSVDAVSGTWTRAGIALQCAADPQARIIIPVLPTGSYELQLRVQRPLGNGSMGIYLPVGGRAVAAVLFAQTGDSYAHQLRDIAAAGTPENVISVAAKTPRPGESYRLAAKVVRRGEYAEVGIELDGKPILRWFGAESELSVPSDVAPSDPRAIGLYGSLSELQFQNIFLRVAGDPLRLLRGPDPGPRVSGPSSGRIVGAELQKVLAGHTARIRTLAYVPGGRALISGGKDNSVRAWNVLTGRSTGTVAGHEGTVLSVVVSAPERLLISGGEDDTVRVWDAMNGRAISKFAGHGGTVWSVAVSPDGNHIASGGKDKTIKVRDTSSGAVSATLEGHLSDVLSVAFSPDGRYLASASYDKTVRLWDWKVGALVATFTGHSEATTCLAFSPDGRLLASSGADQSVKLCDVPDGTEVASLDGCKGTVWSLAFSLDGQTLAAGGQDHKVRLFDVGSRKLIATLDGHTAQVYAVAFAPDGQSMASAGHDQKIYLWNLLKEPSAAEPQPEPKPEPTPNQETAPVVAGRQKVPESTALRAALDEVKQLFEKEYANADTPALQQALADQLLKYGKSTDLTSAQRYALWREAHRLAMAAGDLKLALQAIDTISDAYDVNAVRAKASTLTTTAKKVRRSEARRETAEIALQLADEAVAADDMEAAEEILEAAMDVTSRARDKPLRDMRLQVTRHNGEFRNLKRYWTASQDALQVLSEDANNADAHLALAKYYCLAKGDWQRGLPHLAKCGDAALAELATLETPPPADADGRVSLGDKWFDVSSGRSSFEKKKCIERACYWYLQAIDELDGLELARVEKRLIANDEDYRRTAEGLAGHWKLDEAEGLVAQDATGGQDGSFKGAVDKLRRQREGKRTVVGFTGEQWVEFPKRDFGDEFTIAFWVSASRSDKYGMVMSNSWPRFDLDGFRLFVGTGRGGSYRSRRVLLSTGRNGQQSLTAHSVPGVIVFGQWTHVAVTVNRPTVTARFYINGKDATEKSEIRSDFSTATDAWYIGSARGHYGEVKYQGYLSDVRLFNRELTPSEISKLAKTRGG